MKLISNAKQAFVTVCLCLIALAPAYSREMVSIKGSVVNLREGPSTRTEVLWELSKGYPLEVLKKQGRWIQVRDFENDKGWVLRSLTAKTPYHIVKVPKVNMRKGPGTQHPVIAKLERYDLLRTLAKRGNWVSVKRPNGQTGWVLKRLLWGW
jgi:SH3-like domain-containing protein